MNLIISVRWTVIFSLVFFYNFAFILPSTTNPVFADENLENPKDIIADQIRRQGYECKSPKSAKRNEAQSKPDEPVWELECENSAYRVRLVPDQAAKVDRLN